VRRSPDSPTEMSGDEVSLDATEMCKVLTDDELVNAKLLHGIY
jgi:hypothetical protein